MNGKYLKMKILAFRDCDYRIPKGVYVAQVNPESYALNYKLLYEESQQPGTSGKSARVQLKKPEELTFDFLFDHTGVIRSENRLAEQLGVGEEVRKVQRLSKELGVEADIQKFKRFLMHFDDKSHQPNSLILNWGTLLFKCVLTDLSITYTLFRPNGIPIRAVASATFRGSIPNLLREAIEKFNSPDLTHVRVVKEHDTLLSLCEEIYEDASLYLQVAEVNGITNFRNLQVGREIYFPPIQKTPE